ncbi:MAG: glycogen synthase [Symbiobacteriaceae bacterium]|nr:glycogen synthase [Symbiobacteriaceae bacterium]
MTATSTAANTEAAENASAIPKILYAVSEVAPFVVTGGMGQVVGSLPAALRRVEPTLEIAVVAPLYQAVFAHYGAALEHVGTVEVNLAWRTKGCGIYRTQRDGITYFFLDNSDYFNRENCYGYYDDGERFAFFSQAVLAALEAMQFVPEVIHCHDWQTALIPIYLKTLYREKYPQMRSIFTIHNIEYQGKYTLDILGDVFGLGADAYPLVEYDGCLNLMKGAIVACDRLTTVSPSYAEEIKAGGGYGLDHIINIYAGKLTGILNGIDTNLYNPTCDAKLRVNFDADCLAKKALCKRELQTLFNLPVSPRTPVLCMVSRLVPHKGIDLLTTIIDDLLKENLQLCILGTGDHLYELFLSDLAIRYPEQVVVNIAYNAEISTKIYAGSDMMLMPSLSEPCGLAQMIASRYATVPIVRATGGLKDTIKDCRYGEGNGFVFSRYNSNDFLQTIRAALGLYNNFPEDWFLLMKEVIGQDFSWDRSARDYLELYSTLT